VCDSCGWTKAHAGTVCWRNFFFWREVLNRTWALYFFYNI
jgi:hypothetical protein